MTPFKSQKRRKNDRQYIWEYMRRNRVFKVESLLPLVDEMSFAGMKTFFKQLEHAGYIKIRVHAGRKTKQKKFKDRMYVFIRNTGILCPVWVKKQSRLFDRNIQEVQMKDVNVDHVVDIAKNISELRPVTQEEYAKGRIIITIQAHDLELHYADLQFMCGVPEELFERAFKELEDDKRVLRTGHLVEEVRDADI